MKITMQRHNTIVALGGMFLLLQVLSFIAHVQGSGRKADDVLQLEDNPCRPINFNGRMIPTVPEYMPSFPGSVKGIKRHFVCRPVESTTTPAMTTQNPTSSSSTTKKTTSSSTTTTEAETSTISTMDSTTTDPPTTITSCTTKEPEATAISTMGSTTTDPPATTTSSTDMESTTISTTDSATSGSTTTVSPTTQDTTTMSTTKESTTSNPTTRGEPTVKIFVTDADTNTIFVADLQNQLSFTSIPSSNKPRFITYDSVDKKIYWTDKDEKRVYRADVDGGNRETVTHQGSGERRGIAIAETTRTLYIANNGSKTITSLSIREGSTIQGDEAVFVDLPSEPISLEVDEEQQYLYWTEKPGVIRRKLLDGSGATEDLLVDLSLSSLYGLSIGPSIGGFRCLFFCDFSEEKTFYLEVSDYETYDYELDGLTASGYSTPETKLRDITYFDDVLYWTKESDPSSITVMTDYQSASSRSYEIKETSGIVTPYQLLITYVYP